MAFGFSGSLQPKSFYDQDKVEIKIWTDSIQTKVDHWIQAHKKEFTPKEIYQADAFIKTHFLCKIGPPKTHYKIIRWSTYSDHPTEKIVGYQRLAYKILSEIDNIETSIVTRLPCLPILPTRYALQVKLLQP